MSNINVILTETGKECDFFMSMSVLDVQPVALKTECMIVLRVA